jgi:hypothetical protein
MRATAHFVHILVLSASFVLLLFGASPTRLTLLLVHDSSLFAGCRCGKSAAIE